MTARLPITAIPLTITFYTHSLSSSSKRHTFSVRHTTLEMTGAMTETLYHGDASAYQPSLSFTWRDFLHLRYRPIPATIVDTPPPESALLWKVTTVPGKSPLTASQRLSGLSRVCGWFERWAVDRWQFYFPVDFPAASSLASRLTPTQYSYLLESLNEISVWESPYPSVIAYSLLFCYSMCPLWPIIIIFGVLQHWGDDSQDSSPYTQWYVWLPAVIMGLGLIISMTARAFCRRRALVRMAQFVEEATARPPLAGLQCRLRWVSGDTEDSRSREGLAQCELSFSLR